MLSQAAGVATNQSANMRFALKANTSQTNNAWTVFRSAQKWPAQPAARAASSVPIGSASLATQCARRASTTTLPHRSAFIIATELVWILLRRPSVLVDQENFVLRAMLFVSSEGTAA